MPLTPEQRSRIKTHEHADAGTGLRPLTPREIEDIDSQVASVYDRFLRLVADNRGIDLDEAHERAQGRVWAGEDAVRQRLAGLRRAKIVFVPRVRRSLVERLLSRGSRSVDLDAHQLLGVAATGASLLRTANRPMLIEPAALSIPHLLDAWGLDLFNADFQIE